MKKTMLTLSLCLGVCGFLQAVEPGGRLHMKDLADLAVRVQSENVSEEEQTDCEVVVFLDGNGDGSINAYFQMMEEFAESFRELENPPACAVFLLNGTREMVPEDLSYDVYLDQDQAVWAKYAAGEALVPYALVISDGKVVWKGMPAEIDSVVRRLDSGDFSMMSQQKISAARKDLQRAVQAGLPDVIQRCADKILELQPGDLTAVQAKLYVFEGSGKMEQGLDFLKQEIQKCPDLSTLRMLAMDAAQAVNNRKAFQEILLESDQFFKKNIRIRARIYFYAVSNAPFAWLPFPETLEIASELRDGMKEQKKGFQALVLEFSARAAYLSGNLKDAAAFQSQACALRKGSDLEVPAEVLLDYYRNLENLQQKL